MPRLAKRLLQAAAMLALVSATAAQAQPTPTAPAAAAPSTRLFADSQLVVRDRISVEVTGKGPDLIFVPGLASSRETWRATAERLRGHYRLHLVQVAGFAGEPARANGSGEVVIPTAEAIDAYVVAQKLSPAVYVGHSLGGTMGLWLAEHHGDHFRKMLIVDAWPAYARIMTQGRPVTPDQARAMAEQMRAAAAAPQTPEGTKMMARQYAFFTTDAGRQQKIMETSLASSRPVVAQALYDDIVLDLSDGLPGVKVPITFVYPDNVPAGMPAGMADQVYQGLYATLPGKTLKPVAGSLHFVMWDQPEAFAQALDEFLKS